VPIGGFRLLVLDMRMRISYEVGGFRGFRFLDRPMLD